MRYAARRKFLVGLVLLIILVSAFLCYKQRQAVYTANLDTRPFNVGVVNSIDKLEPALVKNNEQLLLSSAVYEGLLAYNDKTGQLEPRLAKSWKYSKDGKALYIYLKKNICFSNGKKVKAEDVKASWEKNFSITRDWANISMLLPIQGASERLEGKSPIIYGIQVLNDYALKISFDKANAAFIHILTNPMFWVMDNESDSKPLPGTGPYIINKCGEDDVFLMRNDKYHRGIPRLSAINVIKYEDTDKAMTAYKDGKLDYLNSVALKDIAAVRKDDDLKGLLIEQPVMEIYSLGFNMNREPYVNNYMLRRALNYGIDREALVKNILGDAYITAHGVSPLGTKAYNDAIIGYTYNPEKAARLLEEAGYPEGKGLKPLTLSINNDPGHSQIAREIARQLLELGVTVRLQAYEWNYYKKQLNQRELSFFRLGWEADYPDADNFLYSMFHSSKIGVSNHCAYHNPLVDKLLDDSRAELRNEDKRMEYLQKAEKIIIDDAPCLWLFQKKSAKLVGKNVFNLKLNSMESFDWFPVELHKAEPKTEAEGKPSIQNSPAEGKV